MSWVYRFDERALKELKKLSRQAQQNILAYLDERIAGDEDPRRLALFRSSNASSSHFGLLLRAWAGHEGCGDALQILHRDGEALRTVGPGDVHADAFSIQI